MNDTIGIFYNKPDGTLVKTYGFTGSGAEILYTWCDDQGYPHDETCTDAEFQTWTPRRDVKDFPQWEKSDPLLPYSFDLFYDIKRRSQLVPLYEEIKGSDEEQFFRELLAEHEIPFSFDEE